MEATPADNEAVVGDECHIVSGALQGPRHDPAFPAALVDQAANLLLLCRVHHKMIDDQPHSYSVDSLKKIKADHEAWVAASLSGGLPQIRIRRTNASLVLLPLKSGRDLSAVMAGAMSSALENDDLETREEAELVAEFLQELQDHGDMWNDMEASERVRSTFRMGELLRGLETAGFLVFGMREIQKLEGGLGLPVDWPVGIIRVVRSTNSEITRLDVADRDVQGP